MERSQLMAMFPSNGKDVDGAASLMRVGYPGLAAVIPDMVYFLRIHQAPVAAMFCQFFIDQQDVLRDRIGTILAKTPNASIRHVLLTNVIAKWRPQNIQRIDHRLCTVVAEGHDNAWHTDLIALELLIEHNASIAWYRRSWIDTLERQVRERTKMLAQLRLAEFAIDRNVSD